MRGLLSRFGPQEGGASRARPPLGKMIAFYGAKGGVGATTISINTAIALHTELDRKVALVDAVLQFGDHRVFLDLGNDRKSITDLMNAPQIDAELLKSVMVKHDSGVDLLLLEFDSARAGGFEPLRRVPAATFVVLGLVSSKTPELEPRDELLRRIEEASRYVDVERLALSPQCGFASTAGGNPVSEDDQRRKLALVVDVCNEVWGGP